MSGTPSHDKNMLIWKLHIPKNDKIVSRSYWTKLATKCNSKEENGPRGGRGGNKAMDCSRHRVLACIACASDRCNAIETLRWNHGHNKLVEGPDSAHSLDANVAHSTKKHLSLPLDILWNSLHRVATLRFTIYDCKVRP